MPLSALASDTTTIDVASSAETTPAEAVDDAFALIAREAVTPEEGTTITPRAPATTSPRASGTIDGAKPKALIDLRVREGRMVAGVASPPPQIQIVAQWHGVVEEVQSNGFYARVLTADGAPVPEEEGYFPLSMVSDDDRQLVHEGAFFTYTIGRENRYGTRVNMSVLAFRRMPMWHLRQVADGRKEGARIANYLKQATED